MRDLRRVYRGPVCEGAPLSELTSFQLGGRADWLFTPENHEQVGRLLTCLDDEDVPVLVIGEGSNILFRDGGFRGAIIHISRNLDSLEWRGELAVCGAGLPTRTLAGRSLGARRTGLEWAACLPGNLGGALHMNAGAYGGRIAECFAGCRGWTAAGSPLEMGRDELKFGYRRTSLPQGAIITEVSLRLPQAGDESLAAARDRYKWVAEKRRAFRPGRLRTAGSTFKNPEGEHAGRLIDSCGLKGMRVGGVRVSDIHANFMEVVGPEATATDMETLIAAVAGEVKRQCGISLEREVKIYGEK
ncbi:MAG: UDP-N-acetylmuramate dehydrogenase [bacterium]|nr:UDP-N-acetylmuramate dehydrogenase [bacterium]